MKKEFVCIVCPVGCRLTVDDDSGQVDVRGNACPRGKTYGIQEFTAPTRVVTSSVRVKYGTQAMCSVKSDGTVPKEKVDDVLHAILKVSLKAPVNVGDIVIENVENTGANIVATRHVQERKR